MRLALTYTLSCNASFSPVAGIQWVETLLPIAGMQDILGVSVPLPGFSGLRPLGSLHGSLSCDRFSPVAGIQWVETWELTLKFVGMKRFSPVAGIQWVETA